MKKIFIITALAIVAVMLLVACGAPADIARPIPAQNAKTYEITGSAMLKLENGKAVVNGTINVVADTLVAITLDSDNGRNLAKTTFVKNTDQLYAEFAISSEWSGNISASVVCAPKFYGEQSKEIFAIYGNRFENMTSENLIFVAEGNVFVAMSDFIDLSTGRTIAK